MPDLYSPLDNRLHPQVNLSSSVWSNPTTDAFLPKDWNQNVNLNDIFFPAPDPEDPMFTTIYFPDIPELLEEPITTQEYINTPEENRNIQRGIEAARANKAEGYVLAAFVLLALLVLKK